ncbi:permease [Alkalilimnicola ehrlichii]|uniref:Probable membrane transporter protein n=1 Tax=Alkalilimnicola ehrlichii TaxID=351052 RepID=A0A3E0WHH9_9GAMM|nr:sulfite exporter TauE/SafE family protein [Alkalilimnicola ehrlichii]RFA25315.1 permease [Alkalilimnicola ehrlichii]RFA32430.1 permease [Alkalilimnicola ehrlichii]
MPDSLLVVLPQELPPLLVLGLIVTAGITSMITATLGVGGGVLLLAVLASALPPAAIIPVHGMVQLGSNIGRAVLLWRHINLQVLLFFAPGVLLGAWLASLVLIQISLSLLQLIIAGFILLLCWGPQLPKRGLGRTGTLAASTLTTFASMFVGATGPLVAAFVKQQQGGERFGTVATFAAAMTLQHAPKAVVYGAAGFAFREWLGLILLMIASGALGTWAGVRLLGRLNDRRFGQVFNLVLTLLALRLIWQAASA